MKFECHCGHLIIDQTDDLPNKAHVIADENWSPLMDAIDAEIGAVGERSMTPDQACHRVRSLMIRHSRMMYQCQQCGRVYIDNSEQTALIPFRPENDVESREALAGKPNLKNA